MAYIFAPQNQSSVGISGNSGISYFNRNSMGTSLLISTAMTLKVSVSQMPLPALQRRTNEMNSGTVACNNFSDVY